MQIIRALPRFTPIAGCAYTVQCKTKLNNRIICHNTIKKGIAETSKTHFFFVFIPANKINIPIINKPAICRIDIFSTPKYKFSHLRPYQSAPVQINCVNSVSIIACKSC
jgi:hypothetical protein